jgi:hypothetical protein
LSVLNEECRCTNRCRALGGSRPRDFPVIFIWIFPSSGTVVVSTLGSCSDILSAASGHHFDRGYTEGSTLLIHLRAGLSQSERHDPGLASRSCRGLLR